MTDQNDYSCRDVKLGKESMADTQCSRGLSMTGKAARSPGTLVSKQSLTFSRLMKAGESAENKSAVQV